MCWRDNQRNFRRESAERNLNHARAERERAGREWALRATQAQKRAAQTVMLLKQLLAVIAEEEEAICGLSFSSDQLHAHFPTFARFVGFRGPFYQHKGGKCPAVTFYGNLNGLESWIGFTHPPRDINKAVLECMELAQELGLADQSEKDPMGIPIEIILLDGARAFFEELRANRASRLTTAS